MIRRKSCLGSILIQAALSATIDVLSPKHSHVEGTRYTTRDVRCKNKAMYDVLYLTSTIDRKSAASRPLLDNAPLGYL